MDMTQSRLGLAGRDWPVPEYSTVSRRQKTLQVAIGPVSTTTGLHLLVDSTGIKMLDEGEWKTKKHGAVNHRQRRKVHREIDAPQSRSGHGSDRQQYRRRIVLPGLLSQIPADERIVSVSGDGAYDTNDCHEAIALHAAPAIILTRKNAKPWKTNRCSSEARSDILHTTRMLG